MGEYIIDGLGSNHPLKITDSNAALVTGSIYISNVVPISGTITVNSEQVGYDNNEQLILLAGSPTYNVGNFVSGVSETINIKCQYDTYVNFDKISTINSYLLNAGQSLSADLKVGSIYVLAKSSIGSVWVLGGR